MKTPNFRKLKGSGFTLIEIVVAMMAFLLVSLVVYKIYDTLREVGAATSESYMLSSEVGVAVSQLRKELTETSLSSVFISKAGDEFSFASARDEKGRARFLLEGSPEWRRNISYALEHQGEGNVARLVRRVSSREGDALRLPLPAWEGQSTNSVQQKTLVQRLLRPGRVVSESGEIKGSPQSQNPVLQFVRRDETGKRILSSINPSSQSDLQKRGWSSGSTQLLEVNLRILEELSHGKNSYVEVRFSVCPENY